MSKVLISNKNCATYNGKEKEAVLYLSDIRCIRRMFNKSIVVETDKNDNIEFCDFDSDEIREAVFRKFLTLLVCQDDLGDCIVYLPQKNDKYARFVIKKLSLEDLEK